MKRPFQASKLNRLMENTDVTYRDIHIGTKGVVRRNNLYRLRKGKTIYPTQRIVASLARFFQVDPDYFYREDELPLSSQQAPNCEPVVHSAPHQVNPVVE